MQVDSLPAEPPGKPYPNLRAKEMGERFYVNCLSADHGSLYGRVKIRTHIS